MEDHSKYQTKPWLKSHIASLTICKWETHEIKTYWINLKSSWLWVWFYIKHLFSMVVDVTIGRVLKQRKLKLGRLWLPLLWQLEVHMYIIQDQVQRLSLNKHKSILNCHLNPLPLKTPLEQILDPQCSLIVDRVTFRP